MESLQEDSLKKIKKKISVNNAKNSAKHLMGLVLKDTKNPIPLISICYNIQIDNSIVKVDLEQEYYNESEITVETEFFFAISNESCFNSFEAQIRDQVVYGIIKEKEEAIKEYENQKSKGNIVAYSEINKNTPDIMKINIGNLPPKESVLIKFSYYENLQVCVNKFWRFILPSTITPRYANKRPVNPDDKNIVNPKTIDTNNPNAYNWKINGRINSNSDISFFKSPSHPETQFNYFKEINKVEFFMGNGKQEFPNKDFVILFRNEEINQPSVVLSKNEELDSKFPYASMLTFFPDFNENNIDDAYKSYLTDNSNEYEFSSKFACGEYIFLIDRSGSMDNSRIIMAKEALIIFLKSLPINSYCNIVSFGDKFSFMFKESQKIDENILEVMMLEVEKMEADMGGTEIYEALNKISETSLIKHYPKNVFLLTDGCVSDTRNVLSLIEKMSEKSKVYTLGIGNGCSRQLIEEGAFLGKGKHEFVGDDENLNEKTEVLLECFNAATNQECKYKTAINNTKCENIPGVFKLGIQKKLKQLIRNIINEDKILDDIYFAKINDIEKESIDLSIQFKVLNEFTAFICTIQEAIKAPNNPAPKIIIPIIESVDFVDKTKEKKRKARGRGDGGGGGGGGRGRGRGGGGGGRGGFYSSIKPGKHGRAKLVEEFMSEENVEEEVKNEKVENLFDLEIEDEEEFSKDKDKEKYEKHVEKFENKELFMKLIKKQKINGFWEYSEELLKDLSILEKDFKDVLIDEFHGDENYFMTIIVVIWFESFCANQKSTWKLIHKKAIDAIAVGMKDYSKLYEHAKKLFKIN